MLKKKYFNFKPMDCMKNVNFRKRKSWAIEIHVYESKKYFMFKFSYHVKSKNNMQRNLSICALKREII